jgi:hypothetical protein
MGGSMNIQQAIENHKNNLTNFYEIGYPQHICTNDDDYIEYINYCWGYLGSVHIKISALRFYDAESNCKLEVFTKEISRAHAAIEKCHKFLSKDADYMAKYFPNVYTGKLAQGKG